MLQLYGRKSWNKYQVLTSLTDPLLVSRRQDPPAGTRCGVGRMAPGAWNTNPRPAGPTILAPLAFPLEANSHSFLQLPQIEEALAIKGPAKLTLLNAFHFTALLETIAQLHCSSDLAHSLTPCLFERWSIHFCYVIQASFEKNRKWHATCETFRTIKCLFPLGQLIPFYLFFNVLKKIVLAFLFMRQPFLLWVGTSNMFLKNWISSFVCTKAVIHSLIE